jgi:hypothetical protein
MVVGDALLLELALLAGATDVVTVIAAEGVLPEEFTAVKITV